MPIKQTKTLEVILTTGCREAHRRRTSVVTFDHLFLALLKQDGGHGFHVLKKVLRAWEIYQIRIRLERELGPVFYSDSSQSSPSDVDTTQVIASLCAATDPSVTLLNTGHLLQYIVQDRSLLSSRILSLYNLTEEVVLSFLNDLPPNEDYYEDMQFLSALGSQSEEQTGADTSSETSKRSGVMRITVTEGASKRDSEGWERFGTDLTRQAAQGALDPVVGRDTEIERLIQILGRRKKNNPVLIGEAGVGKTAVVEGLALRIHHKQVPQELLNKRIFSLDVASLVAGTKFRGEFEERIQALIRTLGGSDVLLFIDEIHTIIGAGSTQGALDTANILKPALARGTLQCIGATTLNEYRESIEKDGALERRFQKILVEQPTPQQAVKVLENLRSRYEKHHGVHYTDAALAACVSLSQRYLPDRFFPDKAIDVMDEAGSRAHVGDAKPPVMLAALKMEVAEVEAGVKVALSKQKHEVATKLRHREEALHHRLREMEQEWMQHLKDRVVEVDEEAIRSVIASMTGILVTQFTEGEQTRLLQMDQVLGQAVKGQTQAIEKIVRAVRRNRAGLQDPHRPIGVFLFVGPTGVGKTYLAKQLATYLFGQEEALIRIDMSEYAEKHNVSRLIGSPPGYVGYGEGGQLTEQVRRRPYSVVLFDEIEKAHSDVFNLMLQLFDEGQLTDGLGRKIDFRNTVLIMTSNAGSRQATEQGRRMGYVARSSSKSEHDDRERLYRKGLEGMFAPEFLNRIDDIVTFNALTEADMMHIVELELRHIRQRLQLQGYQVEMDDTARRALVSQGYDRNYGVRSLKRALLKHVEDPLAELILSGTLPSDAHIVIEYHQEHFVMEVHSEADRRPIASAC
ncbi:MAG: ATP-dependent Clp protease ATP-binding subunit [Alistipes sp.]|nr:ATP-dependent Clp protease ATP-binding subunit [Alistipes sp.]